MNKLIAALIFFLPNLLFCQTIAEKKASLIESGGDLSQETEKFLQQINLELNESRQTIRKLRDEAKQLYEENAPEEAYQPLLKKIREVQAYSASLQEGWREMIATQGKQEGYALWYQPETTLEQLIIDYGSEDYVYIMKPEVGAIKISVDSNLPIPRASWNEMLEHILTQNGVGIRQLGPFLRELYLLKTDHSAIQLITSKREDLELLAPESRVAFVLTPEPSDVRRIWFFLDNFANPESSAVQLVGRDILLIAKVAEIRDLLRLYDFVSENRGDKEYKAVTLLKVKAEDMANVLMSIFHQPRTHSKMQKIGEKGKNTEEQKEAFELVSSSESNGLQVLSLGANTQALFLVGTREEIRKAEEVIREVEGQIGGARDKVVYWYTVKHSDAGEMAEVLSKVYQLMVATGAGYEEERKRKEPISQDVVQQSSIEQRTVIEQKPELLPVLSPQLYPTDPYFQRPVLPIGPAVVLPANPMTEKQSIDKGNFIVDPKTGSIVMVVEADLLPKIKELIRKMDVPKKMVQLEVLLFEKKVAKQNNYGLNLLRLGSLASNVTSASLLFNERDVIGVPTGIFDFLWSRQQSCSMPAFDLIYRFLLSQDDVTINASPSVLTVNQTPAFIAILEEISVDTGIVEIETAKGVTLKDSFQRAQYGITLKITPTIHTADEEEEGLNTISLDSDITFDTFDTVNQVFDTRPNVTRRNIKNLARVADGETVIIGGLRRKTTEDARDSIPFIGEIPGIGKLFSDFSMSDSTTEMFIFITPKIVTDPACDLEWIRAEEMMRRPGDIPEFLCALVEAEECEKRRLFDGWLTTLFGQDPGRCYTPGWQNPDTCSQSQGEYDGR